MRFLLVSFLVLIVFFTQGCHAVRKKFIRKKKSQKEPSVYVDFKEYPDKPSREAYTNYYIFFRGWLDDLTMALRKGISHKREKRAINEAIMNLEQIVSFYDLEGREKIHPFYEELFRIREEVKKGPNMSDVRKNSLIRKIEGFKRRFEKEFSYSDAEKWMD